MLEIVRDLSANKYLPLLQLLFCHQSCLPCGISDDNTSLLHALDVALVVATDAIANSDEGELILVETVTMLLSQFDHSFSEAIVVLLLLHGIVEG